MTALLKVSHLHGAMVLTANGSADIRDTGASDHGHSPLPKCTNPQCQARRFDPLLGYCRLCAIEARIHGETAALAAAGDPEGTQVYQHLKTAKYPKPEAKKRVARARRKAS